LDRLANALGGNLETDVLVREDASYERVFELNKVGELANRRVICFATHAVYPSSEGDTLEEPGLVLAGTEGGTPVILRASDIRQLRLNADFVLLTACFTGAPSGKSITRPLSGLAQAFFTAGAKCLLVSHWPVDVRATEMLIQAMFASFDRTEYLAAALAHAAKSLRSRAANRHFSHPLFWAGFSIVGDGGGSIATN
jgi:CHAT domain-containing protein